MWVGWLVPALMLTGCSGIRYAVEDSEIPVSLGAPSAAFKYTEESRQWFGVLGLLTYNDLLGARTQPIGTALAKATRRKASGGQVAVVVLTEEWTLLDFAISVARNVLGAAVFPAFTNQTVTSPTGAKVVTPVFNPASQLPGLLLNSTLTSTVTTEYRP